MQVHGLVRKVTSNTQVRSSWGSSKLTHSWRSSGTRAPGRGPSSLLVAPGRPSRPTLSGMAGEFEHLRTRLETISEELADLAMQRLKENIDAGGTELPVDERRLARARRAVERAIAILREPDDLDGLD